VPHAVFTGAVGAAREGERGGAVGNRIGEGDHLHVGEEGVVVAAVVIDAGIAGGIDGADLHLVQGAVAEAGQLHAVTGLCRG